MAGHGDPISILPVAGTLTGAELLVTVQDGETRQFAVIRLLPGPTPPGSGPSGVRQSNTAPIPLTAGAWNLPAWDQTDYDTDSYVQGDPSTFVVPTDGLFHATGGVVLAGTDIGTNGTPIRLVVQGGVVIGEGSYGLDGAGGIGPYECSGDYMLRGGDTIQFQVETDGTDVSIDSGSFAVHRVGSAPAARRHSLLFGAVGDGEALVTGPLADSDTFTLTGWVNFDSLPAGADENWMSRGDDVGDGGWSLAMSVAGDGTLTAGCVLTVPALIGLNVSSLTPIAAGGWHHVAAVFASADSIRLYVDGVLDNSTAITSSVFRGASTHTKFGGLLNGSSPPIHGRLCDPAVWNRALDPADIAALATGSTHPDAFASGLLAYYPVFESGGATLANAVSGGSPATLSGDVAINSLLPPGF